MKKFISLLLVLMMLVPMTGASAITVSTRSSTPNYAAMTDEQLQQMIDDATAELASRRSTAAAPAPAAAPAASDDRGVTKTVDGIEFTLIGVTESKGSSYNRPDDGNVYVIVEFNISNTSSKEVSISSILCFDAYCDGYKCSYSFGASIASDKSTLDGSIAPGRKMNGTIGWEVPADWKTLEVEVQPSLWGKKDTFVYNK